MTQVTECVKNRMNGLIESPTGTGKTMAILCSAIATLKHMRIQYNLKQELRRKRGIDKDEDQNNEEPDEIPSSIIYCTRTHS